MNLDQAKIKMEKCVNHLQDQLTHFSDSGLTSSLIDTIKVEVDGGTIEIRFIANTSDSKECITIRPYDVSICGKISKELSKHGINSFVSGKVVVCPSAKTLTSDGKDKVKIHIKKLGEEAKVAVRMVRQELRNLLDKDKVKQQDKSIQQMTDKFILYIESSIKSRTKDFQ